MAAHAWVVSEQVRRLLSLESVQPERHVAAQVARRRLAVLQRHGLIAHGTLRLFGTPLSAYWLTRKGATVVNVAIAAGGVDVRQLHHDAADADVHLALLAHGATEIWTARILASARGRGALPDGLVAPLGGRHVHIPDLIARFDGQRQLAYEIEMSRKTPQRLAEIMRAYRQARAPDEVWYLAPDAARARALTEAALGVSEVSVALLRHTVPVPSWPAG